MLEVFEPMGGGISADESSFDVVPTHKLVYHVSKNSSFPLSLLKGCRGLITFQHFVVCIITKVCGPKTYTRGAAPTSPRLSNT
jgi:hypothetical protein